MVKFNQFNVTNGTAKAKVSYSLDNRTDGRKCVTLYGKNYSRDLGKVFADEYVNDTDTQMDYFDNGRVVLFEDHKLYAAARARAEANNAKHEAKHAAKKLQREEDAAMFVAQCWIRNIMKKATKSA